MVLQGRLEASEQLATSDRLQVRSLFTPELRASSDVDVGGEAFIAGALAADGAVSVGGNLVVQANLRAAALEVGGALLLEADARLDVPPDRVEAAELRRLALEAMPAPELRCPASELDPELEARWTTLGALPPVATTTAPEWKLDCGVQSRGAVRLPRLVLQLSGPARLEIAGALELDALMVSGPHPVEIAVRDRLRVGSLRSDGPVALYVSDASVELGAVEAPSGFHLTAPRAFLTAPAGLDWTGTLQASGINASGPIQLGE